MKQLLFCLLISLCGCSGDNKDTEIKKKLTDVLSSLHQSDNAAKQASADITSIIEVNIEKLSPEQKTKLTRAASNLTQMRYMLSDQMRLAARDGAEAHEKEWQSMKTNYTALFMEAKTLIAEAASTF